MQLASRRSIDELVRRRQFVALTVKRLRCRHVAIAEKVVASRAVDRELGRSQRFLERLQLGSEREATPVVEIIERFDAGPIAIEPKLLPRRIPNSEIGRA